MQLSIVTMLVWTIQQINHVQIIDWVMILCLKINKKKHQTIIECCTRKKQQVYVAA